MSQPVRDSNQQNSSVSSFDKLHELCAEIRDEVRDVVQYTAPDGQTNIEELLNEKFEQLFSESNNQVTPEVDHAVELFRMYVDEVHYMRELDNNKDKKSDEDNDLFSNPGLFSNSQDLAGYSAVSSTLFRLRLFVCICSFTSTVIMWNVPIMMDYRGLHSSMVEDCSVSCSDGFISYRPYQTLMACGLICFVYSVLLLAFYLLPVDNLHRKYIPGYEGLRFNSALFRYCCQNSPVLLELRLDGCWTLICFITSLTVILSIDKSTPFDCEYSNAYNSQHQIVLYYTLTTFFNSFNSLGCLQYLPGASQAMPLTRASLSMLCVATVAQTIIFLMNLKVYIIGHLSHLSRGLMLPATKRACMEGDGSDSEDGSHLGLDTYKRKHSHSHAKDGYHCADEDHDSGVEEVVLSPIGSINSNRQDHVRARSRGGRVVVGGSSVVKSAKSTKGNGNGLNYQSTTPQPLSQSALMSPSYPRLYPPPVPIPVLPLDATNATAVPAIQPAPQPQPNMSYVNNPIGPSQTRTQFVQHATLITNTTEDVSVVDTSSDDMDDFL